MDAKSLDRVVVRLAVICHDFGKVTTTTPDLRSLGHCQAGEAPTRSFLARIGAPKDVVDRVVPLVREHMAHLNEINPSAVRRLARRLAPATIDQLVAVIRADHAGRPPLPADCPRADELLRAAQECAVADAAPKPLVMGRHLIQAGLVKPGPAMGRVLSALFERQLAGEFADVEAGVEVARQLVVA